MSALHEIDTLWIGERLSFLELLCLKSFVDRGHEVTLFSYEPVDNVPEGVRRADAREFLDDDNIMVHRGRNSPAIHADLFRVKMVRGSDMVWVDCDAYCYRPFERSHAYFFGYDALSQVCNALLGAPKSSEALRLLDEFLSTRGCPLPWWTDEEREAHHREFASFDFTDMRWASTGPVALTWFLRQTGEIRHAFSKDVLYPFPSKRKSIVLRRPRKVMEFITDATLSVHFYGTRMRELALAHKVPDNSFLGHLCKEHGVEVPADARPGTGAAVPAPPQAPKLRPKRQRALALAAVLDLLIAEARPGRPFYVQVGANDGVLADPVYQSAGPAAFDGLLIEPSPVSFSKLSDLYRGSEHVRLRNEGVALRPGTLTLYHLAAKHWHRFPDWAPGVASARRDLLLETFAGLDDGIDECIVSFTVPVQPLSDILESERLEEFDLLLIDVEGMEQEVIESFDLSKHRPKVVYFEVVHMSAEVRQGLFQGLVEHGYRLFDSGNDVIALRSDWITRNLPNLLAALSVAEIETLPAN